VNPQPSRLKKRLFLAGKLLVVAAVVWAVGDTLRDARGQLAAYDWHFRYRWLAAASACYLAGLLPAGLFWHRVLGLLGQKAQLGETLTAYYVGHLGKYVPGKAMVVVLRTGLIRGERVNTAVAAASVFFETLTMMAVGAFISAAILAVWFRDQTFLMLVAGGLMIVAGLPTLPPVFKTITRWAGVGRSDPSLRAKLDQLGMGTLLLGWAAMTIGWVMLGLSLWATLKAVGIDGLDLVRHLPRYVASVSLAMVAGFLSLIPGGLGVRDLILAELMVPYFGQVACPLEPSAAALVTAGLLRVEWLASELAISGVLLALRALRRGSWNRRR
jgi:hypothetical protein